VNPLAGLHARIATWPLWAQTIYYSVEASTIAALVIFGTAFQGALAAKGGLATFDWPQQLHDLIIAVEIGVVKAVIDLLKTIAPPQQKGTS